MSMGDSTGNSPVSNEIAPIVGYSAAATVACGGFGAVLQRFLLSYPPALELAQQHWRQLSPIDLPDSIRGHSMLNVAIYAGQIGMFAGLAFGLEEAAHRAQLEGRNKRAMAYSAGSILCAAAGAFVAVGGETGAAMLRHPAQPVVAFFAAGLAALGMTIENIHDALKAREKIQSMQPADESFLTAAQTTKRGTRQVTVDGWLLDAA